MDAERRRCSTRGCLSITPGRGRFSPWGGSPVSGDALLISAGEEVGSPLESREERPGMSYEAQDGPPTRNEVIQSVNLTQLSNSCPILVGGGRRGPA